MQKKKKRTVWSRDPVRGWLVELNADHNSFSRTQDKTVFSLNYYNSSVTVVMIGETKCL